MELHGAHGYLLAQFLDGEHNRRTDGYGGSLAHRCRVLHTIIDGIRARTGPQFQLGLRLSPERFGITMPESLALAGEVLAGGKLDYLDMSLWDCFKPPQDPAFADRPLIDHFAALPRANTRLGVAGKIMDAATAQRCLEHGADFVLIGRGAMLHHDFARPGPGRCQLPVDRTAGDPRLPGQRRPGPGVRRLRRQHLEALRQRLIPFPHWRPPWPTTT